VSKYRTLSIPEELYNEVEVYIKKHPEKGYAGVTEFFKEALRDKLFERSDSTKKKKP
jgi:metal-responsive CopG/Arc/MetJ family transcriptional regulator